MEKIVCTCTRNKYVQRKIVHDITKPLRHINTCTADHYTGKCSETETVLSWYDILSKCTLYCYFDHNEALFRVIVITRLALFGHILLNNRTSPL